MAALRHDAPFRLEPMRGKLPQLDTEEQRRRAFDAVMDGVYAPSTMAVNRARWSTVVKILAKFGYEPMPPTIDRIQSLGAAFKAGHYRSASAYFSLYRVVALRQGHVLEPHFELVIKDMVRSCARGQGGPVKARALPLLRLGSLPESPEPWAPLGPIGPRNAMVTGAFWLLREIEISTTRACMVEVFIPADGIPRARWHLPVSKSDQQALGVARTHGCACPLEGPPLSACPVHAVWDQLLLLRSRFPGRWQGRKPDWNLPLFPACDGSVCNKVAVVATIAAAADLLRVPRSAPDGSERVSGHSLRVTGAQGLAKAGVDLWAIQLLGRWGSDAVMGYIREAHLDCSAEWARKVLLGPSLSGLASSIAPAVAILDPVTGPLIGDVKQAVAGALGELATPLPWGGQSTEEFAEQLVAPVLEAMVDADFVPQPEEAAAAEAGVERALVRSEQESVLVLNGNRSVVHRVALASLDWPAEQWTTACGWPCGLAAAAAFIELHEVPQGHKALCGKCLPRWRALRKADRSQDGGVPPTT